MVLNMSSFEVEMRTCDIDHNPIANLKRANMDVFKDELLTVDIKLYV